MTGLSRCLLMVGTFTATAQPGAEEIFPLPCPHPYQQRLRKWVETLAPGDFKVPFHPLGTAENTSPESRYRLWLVLRHLPDVSALRRPPETFTLSAIERAYPPLIPAEPRDSQALAFWASWPEKSNPFFGCPAVKRRAMVLAVVDMILLDDLHERNPAGEACRADYLGGNLIWLADTFLRAGDVLSPEPRQAYLEGLRKLADRLIGWGPKGLMTDMDLFAPVGLWYTQRALNDPEFSLRAQSYAQRLFTDPAFFNPAGYFVDNGCFDVSYNGISLYFGTWAALATDWNFTKDAMKKALDLRAHLLFPNPDGSGYSGPSAMSSRTSGDAARDQWPFDPRMQGQAMISDAALFTATIPSPEELDRAPARLAHGLDPSLCTPLPAEMRPWRETHWSRHLPFAALYAPTGHLARLFALQQEKSPLLRSPFLRGESFLRTFGDAFVIGRFPNHAFAIHTGPVGPSYGHQGLPFGFGGGQLCAFWTPLGGTMLLTRRRGVQGKVVDSWDEWASWPLHAVSGLNSNGWLVTTARIRQPTIERILSATSAYIRVTGMLPRLDPLRRLEEPSDLFYERHFQVSAAGLVIETSVRSSANDVPTDLFETFPFLISETDRQTATAIRVQNMAGWHSVNPNDAHEQVKAIRVERFAGQMEIHFETPVRVEFSPLWTDGYQTAARCLTARVVLPRKKDSHGRSILLLRTMILPYIMDPLAGVKP